MGYDDIYRRSRECPDEFWAAAAASIDWYEPWTQVLEQSNPPFYRWFSGGTLNTCHNALDRHVSAGRGDQAALIYDSAVTGTQSTFSYAELTDRVASLAGAIRSLGVTKGDRVVIYMPMIPETVMAMLACARIGAIHSVVFGGFAAKELATR
ncbi:MAG: AMP-binding protein, partial [Chromatiales bacterium]|nr:AMP-binding protein [Chromatiales bacterium]